MDALTDMRDSHLSRSMNEKGVSKYSTCTPVPDTESIPYMGYPYYGRYLDGNQFPNV